MDPSLKKNIVITIVDASDEEDEQSARIEKQISQTLTNIEKGLQKISEFLGDDHGDQTNYERNQQVEGIAPISSCPNNVK